ncbi:MAG: hypothetical protein AAF902_00125 [Chloroflexota bacterium]
MDQKPIRHLLLTIALSVGAMACAGAPSSLDTASATITPTELPKLPKQTVAPLLPTNTPLTSEAAAPQPTLANDATSPSVITPSPTADLNQPVLKLFYEIPAVQLKRTLEANLAGKLTLIDETTGEEATVPNGQRLLTEINGAIQTFKGQFEPVPPGCKTCVVVGYDLPLAGESARGILTNTQLQVSIQHLFSTRMGPHFPPDTVLGHHLSASGYTLAQTAAITSDGTLYQWIAADPQITQQTDQVLPTSTNLENFKELAQRFSGVDLVTECTNFPIEYSRIDSETLQIRCPELSLPLELISPYEVTKALIDPLLEDERNFDIPSTFLPFGARLFYEQDSGNRVTIFEDGSVEAKFIITNTIASTETETVQFETILSSIPAGEIDPLIIPMLASDVIPRGVRVSVANDQTDFDELLLIRSIDGVYEFAWSNKVGQGLIPGIQILDLLIEELRPPD